MSEFIHQWAPQPGVVRRTLPRTSDSWSPTESIVAKYIEKLKSLDIADPTKATGLYPNAIALRDHTMAFAAKREEEANITNRLAQGELSPTEAAKLLAKVPSRDETEEQAARAREMLSEATRKAYAAAVHAVHLWGEDNWLALLRPIVQEAVAAQNQQRWDALHDFAALLRDRDLGALAMVASDVSGLRAVDETWRYKVGRPDLYHLWRLERAEDSQNIAHVNAGPVVFLASVVKQGPHPTLTEMVEHDMEPGLYGAAEVVAITEAIHAEQQAAQSSADPRPSRRAEVTF